MTDKQLFFNEEMDEELKRVSMLAMMIRCPDPKYFSNTFGSFRRLVLPESLEAVWYPDYVARRVMDIAMAQIGLQHTHVDAVLRQFVAAGMA